MHLSLTLKCKTTYDQEDVILFEVGPSSSTQVMRWKHSVKNADGTMGQVEMSVGDTFKINGLEHPGTIIKMEHMQKNRTYVV